MRAGESPESVIFMGAPACTAPKCAVTSDLRVHGLPRAARWYSLMTPLITFRRRTGSPSCSATRWISYLCTRCTRCCSPPCRPKPGPSMQRDILLLTEMTDAAEQAQRLADGITVSQLEADRQRRDALLWNFTVLGEPAGQVSEGVRARFRTSPGSSRSGCGTVSCTATGRSTWPCCTPPPAGDCLPSPPACAGHSPPSSDHE
jgi:hypothetical protein